MSFSIILRYVAIFFSIIFLLIGGYNIFKIVSELTNSILESGNVSFEFWFFVISVFLLILGYTFLMIGIKWKKSFGHFSKSVVGIAILSLSIFIILYSINSNSDDVVESIQPSLDYLVASSFEDMLSQSLDENSGEEVKVIFSNNQDIRKIYVSNITDETANLFHKNLELDDMNISEKRFLTKFLINEFYKEMSIQDPNLPNTPISFDMMKKTLASMGVGNSLFNNLYMIRNTYEINSSAYITISLSNNTDSKTLIIGNVTKVQAEMLWDNLNFKNVSSETKITYSNIFLSMLKDEMDKSGMVDDITIPLSSIAGVLPGEVKTITGYDIFHENISIRVLEINRMRDDCKLINSSSEICSIIILTEYDTLMKNVNNISKSSNVELPFNLSNLESINSVQKIDNTIDSKTSNWGTFLLFWFIFMALAVGFFYINLKINYENHEVSKIAYYITRFNLENHIPAFIIFIIFYYFIASGYLVKILSSFFPKDLFEILNLVVDMPIYNVFIDIFWLVILLNIVYVVISIVCFIVAYYFHKKST